MLILYYILWGILTITAISHLLLHKREPVSTISWLLFVIAFPVIGPLFFFSFGPERLVRQATKRKREIDTIDLETGAGSGDAIPLPQSVNINSPVFRLTKNISDLTPTNGNRVELLHDPSEALKEMVHTISNAKSYIHLEYYIINSDHITEQIFDSLIEARGRGVEVRILYDALGSLFLKRIYFRRLKASGIQIAGFLPFSLIPQRFNVNFRNHRKILVVDGQTAFTGGSNIGKEYLGKLWGHQWRDFSVKITGPACLEIEEVFRKDWQFTTQEDLYTKKYYPVPKQFGDATIQVLESGPDSEFYSLHQALFLAITSSQKEVCLMTPYFIPDTSMLTALTVTALRGVKVKLVLPLKSDARFVQLASRSFYDELLRAGVEIYEFEPKVLHAKLLTIDNEWTVLGSGNMDIRSFRLNFEISLFIHSPSVTESARSLFQSDLEKSRMVNPKIFQERSVKRRLLENACRLMSPIL